MPDILIQLKLNEELHDRIRLKLARFVTAHEEEVEAFTKEIKTTVSDEHADEMQARWDALHERGKRLTVHNLIRVALEAGIDRVTMENGLKKIAEEGVSLGRPRRATE